MSTRTSEDIRAEYRENTKAIEALYQRNVELQREDMLLSDDRQWFTEEVETWTVKEDRKNKKVDVLAGRIHWFEDFTDESTGDVVTVERKRLVRKDGEWI